MSVRASRNQLLATTIACAGALGGLFSGVAAPALAQTAQPSSGSASDQTTTVKEVVITGSILTRKLSSTENPVTTFTSQDLDARGVSTMADAVQMLAANGAATLPNSFTANGAFAAGASAASLRGLTTNSTLTLIDGMRTAYYPLADDGVRNFVDMNSIPDVVVDRVETLKDGASSTYGADAIAGVINVITKKSYEGLTVKAEGGFTEEGHGDNNNYQILAGHGDLATDGYNVYIGIEYEHDDALYNRDRPYPYDTNNLSTWCAPGQAGTTECRLNNVANGLQANGAFTGVGYSAATGSTNVPIVLPVDASGDVLGNYQLLNPAAGCGNLKSVTVTPAQALLGGAISAPGYPFSAPVTLCQQDNKYDYGEISPDDKRFSVSFRGTKELGGDAEAYVSGTFYQNDVLSRGAPSNIQQQATPGPNGLAPYNSIGITLPVYVCSSGVNCSASNGTLNPNNPFAAQGQLAQIFYQFGDIPVSTEQFSQTFRLNAGVKGSFDLWGQWKYNVDLALSQIDMTQTYNGEIYIANLLQAINTGSYNFVNPSANTAAERAFIAPTDVQNTRSQLAQLQATASRELMDLPGGPLQLGLIAVSRYESIYDPTANTDAYGATERYFTINPVGLATEGRRYVQAAAFELDAPIFKQLDVDMGGRFDYYSTGAEAFSPKIGARFTPIKQITFRGTASQGFRIPSFSETNAVPTTGFVNASTGNLPASVLAAFNAAHGNDGYGVSYALGETSIANPDLKPERSKNFTGGVVFEPDHHLSFSVDLYYISKKDVIAWNTTNLNQALVDYFSGLPTPAGYKVIAGAPDPNAPNALATPGFIDIAYANLNREVTGGYDFGATARYNLPWGIHYTSYFDGNYVLYLSMVTPTGVQKYAGTIGPYNDVSASGTPKFRASWQNTFAKGPFSFSAIGYFTSGYDLEGADFGDTPGLCTSGGVTASAINTTYYDGVTPVQCKVKAYMDLDTAVTYQATKHIQLFMNVLDLFGKNPPLDPTTYGGYNYNPAWGNTQIYGRTFKIGIKATF